MPLVELDKVFWDANLSPTPTDKWREIQASLISGDRWIMDGDLGPYDQLDVRLTAADTIIVLDFSLVRCAWRALRRSRERADFWLWLIRWRRQSLPLHFRAISEFAPTARLFVVRTPRALEDLLTSGEAFS